MLSFELGTLIENNKNPITGSNGGPNSEHESSLIRSVQMTARYPMSSRFGLLLSLPHRDIAAPKDVGGSTAKHIDRHFSGIGDTILLGRYQVDGSARASEPQFHALLGMRLPTGDANPNHSWPARDGSTILSRDPVLQPGFGTLDPIFGFDWSRPQRGGRSLYFGALYRPTVMLNRYGYEWGSEFQATWGASLPMGRKFTLLPQLFLQMSGHDHDFQPLPSKVAGTVSNTGGDWIYFMPNFRYGNVEFNVQLPIYRRTNGNILNPSVVFGVRTNFDWALRRGARSNKDLPRDRIIADDERLSQTTPVISAGPAVDLKGYAVQGKVTIIQFFTPTCQASKSVAPVLRDLVDHDSAITLKRVDVSDGQSPVVLQHKITVTPTFVVFSGKHVIGRQESADSQSLRRLVGKARHDSHLNEG